MSICFTACNDLRTGIVSNLLYDSILTGSLRLKTVTIMTGELSSTVMNNDCGNADKYTRYTPYCETP
jgi:hypothetical protein